MKAFSFEGRQGNRFSACLFLVRRWPVPRLLSACSFTCVAPCCQGLFAPAGPLPLTPSPERRGGTGGSPTLWLFCCRCATMTRERGGGCCQCSSVLDSGRWAGKLEGGRR